MYIVAEVGFYGLRLLGLLNTFVNRECFLAFFYWRLQELSYLYCKVLLLL